MRTLLAVLLLSFASISAAGPAGAQDVAQNMAQGQASTAEVERYINSIRTLKARFVQSNPNGSVVQGTLYVRRPGRMRFEYDPPSKLKIVADGYQVTMWDIATKDFGQWPIGWTAASFLVKEPLSLTGDLQVEKTERSDGMLQLTMSQAKKPQEGKVIVRLAENPMSLRGWTIIDNRGNHVNVSLQDVQAGMELADSLFKFDGPDPGMILRGGN
ncbi:MAG: outer membrane lipoprotein carrier protein LolA [Reyranella sp.]|nr:outer membrane lipoprotein carrier protein LolA [Reyranella sp.]